MPLFLKHLEDKHRFTNLGALSTLTVNMCWGCHAMGQILKKRGFLFLTSVATNIPHGKLTADLLVFLQLPQQISIIHYRAYARK